MCRTGMGLILVAKLAVSKSFDQIVMWPPQLFVQTPVVLSPDPNSTLSLRLHCQYLSGIQHGQQPLQAVSRPFSAAEMWVSSPCCCCQP